MLKIKYIQDFDTNIFERPKNRWKDSMLGMCEQAEDMIQLRSNESYISLTT
jgi:hypothetical protein